MSLPIELDDLHVHHGDVRAVDGVDLRIDAGSICGLLGRNGAGKSTLLMAVAAYRRPTSGQLRVGGREPYEDAVSMGRIAYVPAARRADADLSVSEALEVAALFRPTFERSVAERLLARFDLGHRSKVGSLSTGQRSAFTIALGLAARAPVTLFDEAHLGMDAVARAAFYEEILIEYTEHPRTIVISSHLVDEIAHLLDDVVVLDHGRVLEHRRPDDLRACGARLIGPVADVDAALAHLGPAVRILAREGRGRFVTVVVLATDGGPLPRPTEVGGSIDLEPLPLQDLFVHLTSQEVPA